MKFMRWSEKYILTHSDTVIAICPHLKQIALETVPDANVHVIENLAQQTNTDPSPEDVVGLRREYGLENAFVVGYTGTFEVNQGLELMAKALALVQDSMPDAKLFFVGGKPEQVNVFRDFCRELGIEDRVVLPGILPPEKMQTVMMACDVLTSPRSRGTNTPLKIYSYLKSSVPILATDLLTHTQVLDNNTAILTEPTPESLSEGLLKLYNDTSLRKSLAQAALELEQKHYSYPAYREKTIQLLDTIPALKK